MADNAKIAGDVLAAVGGKENVNIKSSRKADQ